MPRESQQLMSSLTRSILIACSVIVTRARMMHNSNGQMNVMSLSCSTVYVWWNVRGRARLSSSFESPFSASLVGRWQIRFEYGTRMMIFVGVRCLIRTDRW